MQRERRTMRVEVIPQSQVVEEGHCWGVAVEQGAEGCGPKSTPVMVSAPPAHRSRVDPAVPEATRVQVILRQRSLFKFLA